MPFKNKIMDSEVIQVESNNLNMLKDHKFCSEKYGDLFKMFRQERYNKICVLERMQFKEEEFRKSQEGGAKISIENCSSQLYLR